MGTLSKRFIKPNTHYICVLQLRKQFYHKNPEPASALPCIPIGSACSQEQSSAVIHLKQKT